MTQEIPVSSTTLSLVPNVSIAKSSRKGGVRSMTALPTDRIGVGTPVKKAAASDDAATPAPAASSPAAAADTRVPTSKLLT